MPVGRRAAARDGKTVAFVIAQFDRSDIEAKPGALTYAGAP